MSDKIIEVKIGSGTLYVVPAVHFRVAFAARVNQLARDLRPDAVAVELGPETAAAGAAWLHELGIGPNATARFPCMLGLMQTNRRIRPSKRDMAMRLQESTGKDLGELPPELLKESLGFSAMRVLYLSPTDSIVEAIRCALELQVPLYGVDLEETAERQPPDGRIQDPTGAWGEVEKYVRINQLYAEGHRDQEIDGRREVAMAARLKTLLAKHQRVLFTCGLAHWLELRHLLADTSLAAAPIRSAAEIRPEGYRRVVVHPLLAVHHLDLFPAMAQGYYEWREPAHRELRFPKALAPREVFLHVLRESYTRHFIEKAAENADRIQEDWESRVYFEQFMSNLCQVRQLHVPDLFAALVAAQGTMSPEFRTALAAALMQFPWESAKAHPELDIISPAPAHAGDYVRAELAKGTGQRGKHFYIDPLPGRGGGGYKVQVPIPWEWNDLPPPEVPHTGQSRAWNPADSLKTALSARAIDVAKRELDRPRTELFEGSLLQGIDRKATMRAVIRGDERIYVRDVRQTKSKTPDADGFPVVWIFQTNAAPGCEWAISGELVSGFEPPAKKPERLTALRAAARYMLLAVDYSVTNYDSNGFECRRLSGILLYSPPHFTIGQHGKWAEATDYQRNPFGNDLGRGALKLYAKPSEAIRTPFDVNEHAWTTALILMAIPFAGGAMTVVAPDGFSWPRIVTQHAARYGVTLNFAPLSFFPRALVEKMATDYFVPALPDGDGNTYPPEVERIMGEEPTAYRRLVPRKWLEFGAK